MVSHGPIVCREECMKKCIRNITTKWWLLKIELRCKTTLGVRFFEFFTSKNIPPYGTCHGCKFFFDISKKHLLQAGHPHQDVLKKVLLFIWGCVVAPQDDFSLIENPDYYRIVVHLIGFWMVSVVGVELLNHHNGGRLGAVIGSKAFNRKRNS